MPHLALRGRRPRTPSTPRSLALRAPGAIVAGTALLAAAPTMAQASAAMPRPAPFSLTRGPRPGSAAHPG